MANIVIISPKFDASYWGMEHALGHVGKCASIPIAALPLLAALTPSEHNITLIDEAVEDLDYDKIAKADIVGVTGMIVQRMRMKNILAELKERGAFTVVGGAWVTVQEDYFGDLADVIFVGEAETTWPEFLEDWKKGKHRQRYEQSESTDMTTVPTPRFDLLPMQKYLFGSMQFSRGCPFQCEFCDIIVTFGRRPRLKTSQQVIKELDAMRKTKMRIVFIVDDNLIGNKKAIKVMLRDVIAYQHKHGFPFIFFTEASLDLAEDAELMQLMLDANIISVFIGIESPNDKALKETKKYQNVRPAGGTIMERVHRIQDAGLEVWCGMIVGFDNDGPDVFEMQRQFIQQSRIVNAMIGMLYAIPKTPLHARLLKDGRLDLNDRPGIGTNIYPLQMSPDEIRDGYAKLLHDLYHPDAYFQRLEDLYLRSGVDPDRGLRKYWKKRPFAFVRTHVRNAIATAVLFGRLVCNIPEPELRREYRKRLWTMIKSRPNPSILLAFAFKCAMHHHQWTMAKNMVGVRREVVNTF